MDRLFAANQVTVMKLSRGENRNPFKRFKDQQIFVAADQNIRFSCNRAAEDGQIIGIATRIGRQ